MTVGSRRWAVTPDGASEAEKLGWKIGQIDDMPAHQLPALAGQPLQFPLCWLGPAK